MTGQTISHFRILEKLGAGGMGVVYRAHDEQLDRDVAIKVLPAESFHDPAARARLLREARTASKLNHPHVCTIHEVGEADDRVFIAMELVEGRPLSKFLESGALPAADVLRFGIQLADAMAHAHQRGIVHRDLKSANVIVTPEGRVKVLDFGLAKRMSGRDVADATTKTVSTVTEAGVITGTLAYMAPEQLRGQQADARSDIWALGVVLYEMAAGVRPFKGDTGFELSSAILTQPPAPLPAEVAADLRAVVERCLEKEPARRCRRSEEVRSALEAIQTGAVVPAWQPRKPSRRKLVLATAPVAAVAFAAALDVGGVRTRLWNKFTGPRYRALAVLPVTNLSGDPAQEYFVDGMTDALITDLSKIGALKVISRTSVMRYKGVKKSLQEIARDLDVDTVLEASVAREAGRVRVAAKLIEASSERNLWAESYERDLSSVLVLQGEVARAVARAARVTLRPQEEARLAGARKINPATYEAYLRGMFHLNRATPEDTAKGMAYLHEAVAKDPADPLAYAGLALGYIEMAHSSEARADELRRAKAAAQTALKLDDSLAETLMAMGFVKGYYDWNWEEAERDIQRALDINPSLAIAHYHLAWYRILFGRMKDAIEEHKRAQELDPFNPMHTAWLGDLYRRERRFEEAAAEARRSIEMAPKFPPGYMILANVYVDQRMYDEAIAAAKKAEEASPNYRWLLAPIHVKAGRVGEARKLLAELNQQPVNPWTAWMRVRLYTALGDNDEAFRWLNYEPHHMFIPWTRVGDWAAPLRQDPRFPAQLRRMNLPPV